MPSAYHLGGYGAEIHEMSEMAINCWGQWELNNQVQRRCSVASAAAATAAATFLMATNREHAITVTKLGASEAALTFASHLLLSICGVWSQQHTSVLL